jgi:hypothetical protein
LRGLIAFLVSMAASAVVGCSGGSDPLRDGPPSEFLEAHLSFGDDDDTSMCYRVQQLVMNITMIDGEHEWKQLDDSTWEISQNFQLRGQQASSRMRFQREGDLVLVSDYEERVDGAVFTEMNDVNFGGFQWTFFQNMKTSGALPVKGCADPVNRPRHYGDEG